MHRRWIVAVPLGLLVVSWLHYARHGVAAVSAHAGEEESAESRVLSGPPSPDDTSLPADVAPTAPAVGDQPAPAILPGGAGPMASAPVLAPRAVPTDAEAERDVQAGINAIANVDYDDAAAKFERACSHGSAFACGALGKLLATGTGLHQDVKRGRAFLTRGCTSEETWACNHLAAIDHAQPPPR